MNKSSTDVITRADFSADVDDIDSTLSPLAHRSASTLKKHYREAKKDFTLYYEKWSVSGQNDPHRFPGFLPKLNNGALMSSSIRALIVFKACRCGTRNEDTNLLSLVTRVMPTNIVVESGIGLEEDMEYSIEPQRKKRKSADSSSLKNLEGYLAQVSKSSLQLSQALTNERRSPEKDDDRSTRMHKKLELFRTELKNRELDGTHGDDELDQQAQKFLREMSHRHLSDLMDSIREL